MRNFLYNLLIIFTLTNLNTICYASNATSLKVNEIILKNNNALSDAEAIEIINLNLTEALDSQKIKSSIDKLLSHYKNLGYQKATAQYSYNDNNNLSKNLIIEINSGPKTIIKSVVILGLNDVDTQFIKNNTYWNFIGKTLTEDLLKKINIHLKTVLNNRGLYLVNCLPPRINYNADDTKVDLIYSFSKKQKYEILIEGTKKFSEYDLKNDVLKLSDYSPTDDSFPDEILTKLQNYYLSQGYSHSDIKYSRVLKNEQIILTYKIKENEQTFIYLARINGTFSKPESYYLKEFYNLASTPIQNGLFIKSDLEQASKNLGIFLKNNGYLSSIIKKTEIYTDSNYPSHGHIIMDIDEGPQTKISAINFFSYNQNTKTNPAFDSNTLKKALDLKDFHFLNLTEFELGLTKLKIFYANHGYLEMKILNTSDSNLIEFNEDFSSSKINIQISEGPQIYAKNILIEGNILTKEKVIFSELDFKQGDLLTPQKLEESTARLQKTGLFSSIEIKMLENNSNTTQRTIIISLNERKPGILTTGLGITNENDYTLHGYAGVAYRNIGGWGRGLSLRGEGSYNPTILNFLESKVTVGYLEPYLFDTRIRFRVNYTTSRVVSDYTIRQKTITNQAVWSVEQDITSHLTGIWQIYNIANYVDEGITLEDEIKYNYSRDDLVIASTGPTFDLDYRDNVLNPTSGSLSRLILEYATSNLGSINTDDFLRVTGQTTFYFNLIDQVVWANSFRGGYLQPLNKNSKGVRFDKKGFTLGGRSTIRGFESTEFFPSANDIGANYRLNSNTSYELLKSEFRFPLFSKSDLSGAFFYDGGRILIDNLPTSSQFQSEWRDSIGIGIRYNLPIGPLNLEYARKLNKKSYESDGAFHLSVGVF